MNSGGVPAGTGAGAARVLRRSGRGRRRDGRRRHARRRRENRSPGGRRRRRRAPLGLAAGTARLHPRRRPRSPGARTHARATGASRYAAESSASSSDSQHAASRRPRAAARPRRRPRVVRRAELADPQAARRARGGPGQPSRPRPPRRRRPSCESRRRRRPNGMLPWAKTDRAAGGSSWLPRKSRCCSRRGRTRPLCAPARHSSPQSRDHASGTAKMFDRSTATARLSTDSAIGSIR